MARTGAGPVSDAIHVPSGMGDVDTRGQTGMTSGGDREANTQETNKRRIREDTRTLTPLTLIQGH
jgi:hypothetical protein